MPGSVAVSVGATPESVLRYIAIAASGMAGLGLIACGVLAVFGPDKWQAAKLAALCVACIVIAQLLYWIGEHLAIAAAVSVLVAIVCGASWLWFHRMQAMAFAEDFSGKDLNNNGKVGS